MKDQLVTLALLGYAAAAAETPTISLRPLARHVAAVCGTLLAAFSTLVEMMRASLLRCRYGDDNVATVRELLASGEVDVELVLRMGWAPNRALVPSMLEFVRPVTPVRRYQANETDTQCAALNSAVRAAKQSMSLSRKCYSTTNTADQLEAFEKDKAFANSSKGESALDMMMGHKSLVESALYD